MEDWTWDTRRSDKDMDTQRGLNPQGRQSGRQSEKLGAAVNHYRPRERERLHTMTEPTQITLIDRINFFSITEMGVGFLVLQLLVPKQNGFRVEFGLKAVQ